MPTRDEVLASGVTINGLPIMLKRPYVGTLDIDELDIYYEDCVIGGPGAFVVPIREREKFIEATRTNWSSRLPDGYRKDASFQFRRRRLASPAQSVKRCGRSDGAEASISGSRKLLRKFCDDFRVMRVAELVNRHDALKLVTTFDQDFRIACECRRVA